MIKFKEIRLKTLENWNNSLNRTREEGDLSDNYSKSEWCNIQNEFTEKGHHCSFICSINDWLDNISDMLYDNRFDKLTDEDYEILFRYYTRILLVVSEIIEDFVCLNKNILKLKDKNESSRSIEHMILDEYELKNISDFINSVCKHKTQNQNFHINNHHLVIEFEDFGKVKKSNQISLKSQDWKNSNLTTTILISRLSYFIEVIIKIQNKIIENIQCNPIYKENLFNLYVEINATV